MKLIIAIVRPFTVEKIVNAFERMEGFPGMTMIDSQGFGQRVQSSPYDAFDPFKPNKRVEIACNDEMVDQIVSTIRERAHTGRKGDGVICVCPLEQFLII